MRVAVNKIEGVESVEVSLDKASAAIRLKPDNRVTLARLREVIRKNGYPTKDAAVTARGRLVAEGGGVVLDLLNGSRIEVTGAPAELPAGVVEIVGVARSVSKDADRLQIQSVGAAK